MNIKQLVQYIRDYGVDGTALHPLNLAEAKKHDKVLHDKMMKVSSAQDDVTAYIKDKSDSMTG